MKKVLIGCGSALLLFCITVSIISFFIYNQFKDFPDYARAEVVYKKYDTLIKRIDEQVNQSDTALSLAAKLEKMALPDSLVYMALKKTKKDNSFDSDDKNILEIIKTLEHGSNSTMIIDGAGYGNLGATKIIIIDYAIDKIDGVGSCLIYFKH